MHDISALSAQTVLAGQVKHLLQLISAAFGADLLFCVLATNVRKYWGLCLVELREYQKDISLLPAPAGVLKAFGPQSKVCTVCLAHNTPLAPLQARLLNQPPHARLGCPRVSVQTSPVSPFTMHPSVDWQRGTDFEPRRLDEPSGGI